MIDQETRERIEAVLKHVSMTPIEYEGKPCLDVGFNIGGKIRIARVMKGSEDELDTFVGAILLLAAHIQQPEIKKGRHAGALKMSSKS